MSTPDRSLTTAADSEIRSFPEHGIFGLKERVEDFTGTDRAIAKRILSVQTRWGKILPPETMDPWIIGQFGNRERVLDQPIVRVDVTPLMIGTAFNEVRSSRPQPTAQTKDEDGGDPVEKMIQASLAERDVFALPEDSTPAEEWGRIRGIYSRTAANVAKIIPEHALVIFDEPNPIKFTKGQVVDYIMTSEEVWRRQHLGNPNAIYPLLFWQCLGKAAASQVHGHLQVLMGEGRHFPDVQRLRKDAEAYKRDYGANFWMDYAYLHEKLGLMIRKNGVVVMAHVAPIKEKEIWAMGEKLDAEFAGYIFDLLHCYVNRLGVKSFTLSIVKPPMEKTDENWSEFPVLVRLLDRGDPLSSVADMGGLEIYGGLASVSSDPYYVAWVLREHWREIPRAAQAA